MRFASYFTSINEFFDSVILTPQNDMSLILLYIQSSLLIGAKQFDELQSLKNLYFG